MALVGTRVYASMMRVCPSATATTANPFLPANTVEYVTVTPGQRIAAIKAATNGLVTATAGTLWVTELS
jgi:hypothetical protein